MADEMIQQVPQQRGSYAVPGLIGGAIVGGAAGVTAAHYNKGWKVKPDLDKVFAQDPDTFKRQIENGGENKGAWETAQEWANKIKQSDAEYDKKVAEITKENTVAKDPDIAKKLEEAQKKYNTALEAEKQSLSKTTGGLTTEFKFPTADEVKNLGDKVSIAEINEYNTRLNNYKTALNNAKVNADRTALENFKANVMNHVYDIDRVSHKPKSLLLPGFTHKMAMNQMINILDRDINALIPEISDPKRIQHELKLAGKDYKPGSKNYRRFVNQLNEQVRNDRAALREQILGEKIQVDIIDPKTNKVKGKRTTYKNIESFIKGEENTFNREVKLEKKLPKGVTYASLDTVENYKKQLEKLQKNKHITIATKEAREKYLNKMIELATEKENIQKVKDGRMNRFFGRISYTNKLEEKINKAIQNDSQVQSALQKLKNFAEKNEAIKGIAFSTTEETKLTADEIAKKAVENLSKEQVATDLEALKKQAEEKGSELTEKGKKLIAELGSKEKYSSKVREDAKKVMEAYQIIK